MKLFLLERITTIDSPVYDCNDGFVVAAKTSHSARKIARGCAGDEGALVWVDARESTCQCIAEKTNEKQGIILTNFHAG